MAALTNLARREMLIEIAAGLPIALESARELTRAADDLTDAHSRSKAILELHAEEEAAKALMLLDLVRCPARRQAERQRLGKQLTDHLARLIYAEASSWSVATFAELRGYVELERKSHYLDGPEGIEFIYSNKLLHERQEVLYFDRVEWEHGTSWHKPEASVATIMFPPLRVALKLVSALEGVGAFRREALILIDEIWNVLDLADETHWSEIAALNEATLEAFDARNWLENSSADMITRVRNWHMPLYPLDCRMVDVTEADLEDERQRALGRMCF